MFYKRYEQNRGALDRKYIYFFLNFTHINKDHPFII